jgi:hypothetical protein
VIELHRDCTTSTCHHVTGARRDNVGFGNKEYYLCNLYNGTRVENRIK